MPVAAELVRYLYKNALLKVFLSIKIVAQILTITVML